MADLEKVISSIQAEIYSAAYYGNSFKDLVPVKLLQDALSLLKAQEPIEPIELYGDTKCVEDYNRTLAWKCGKCGYYIGGADNFCANCGRAVKWE